jgi:glycosyltransferase involved in cell wall biosynthesis
MSTHGYFVATSGGSGPIPSHLLELSRTLAKRGHRVIILIGKNKKYLENHITNPSIYAWPSSRPTKLRDAIFLFKLIRYSKPDCLVANFGSVNLMMLIGWLTGVPHRVCWYHTLSSQIAIDSQASNISLWKQQLLQLRKRLIYTLATKIVAVSEASRHDLCQVFHINKEKCLFFYNDLQDPLALQGIETLAPPSYKLICVGRLFFSKGQDILIRAIADLLNDIPNISLQFIGDGPTKSYLYNLVSELGLADKCCFAGALSHTEVIKHLASSYVSIVPSRSEAFGLVVIESMAVGTPVVAANVGGLPEIVRDGLDGFLVPPDNPGEIAAKLLLLLKNPYLRATMAKNARQRFLEKFEQKNAVVLKANWLESLLAGSTT